MTQQKNKSAQGGTLLVEALAMLGLIAMVTPTLYKKSAERLQEIQDINSASQARTMAKVMDTFMRLNFDSLYNSASSETNNTVEISYDDSSAGMFHIGYSSYLPYGYSPDEIRGYEAPKIYVHRDGSTLVSYILYPKVIDPGDKRAARMASLVGANGGLISEALEAKGTGGAWYLDSTMVDELGFDSSALTKNSLIVTSDDPVTKDNTDSNKFLYRVPPDNPDDPNGYYHNTMVTDLYMGGTNGEAGDYTDNATYDYSIYNVKRLTLNTNCSREVVRGDSSLSSCPKGVADLYIGQPTTRTLYENDTNNPNAEKNTGAAWIYGNFAALSDNFQLFRASGSGTGSFSSFSGYNDNRERIDSDFDVLQFSRMNSSGSDAQVVVLRAENQDGYERVAMMDDFVQVGNFGSSYSEFRVGSSDTGTEGGLIQAYRNGNNNYVHINKGSSTANTYINESGGDVWINGINGGSSNVAYRTYINPVNGELYVGKEGGWLTARQETDGTTGSASVHILTNDAGENRVFSVGYVDGGEESGAYTGNAMIYADSTVTSLRGGALRAYTNVPDSYDTKTGGESLDKPTDVNSLEHRLLLAARYTDILGPTHIGNRSMSSSTEEDGKYSRNVFDLGVAGSAWVDQLLWARKAWILNGGMKELHAGFDSFKQFENSSETAWLNAYKDGVMIRNKDAGSGTGKGDINDVMLNANSTQIYMNDLKGAFSWLEGGVAMFGAGESSGTYNAKLHNFFMADADSSNVIGSSLVNMYTAEETSSGVVNLQKDAFMLTGNLGKSSSSYTNRIDARTGAFTLTTKVSEGDVDENAQMYADKDLIRMRDINFEVQDSSHVARLAVMPNEPWNATAGSANVMVNGSFHVTGNEVIHVASNSSNAAGIDSSNAHAMLEIDPNYISVWSKDDGGNYVGGSSGAYYAMLKINPYDTEGDSSSTDDTNDASVYIRKGAIELEQSDSSSIGQVAADAGFGYIKANRFVSNAGLSVPQYDGTGSKSAQYYDQYMVNPAYTSVMHDIKLTTRGGARLSDILPDYVLKGVYNISNDYMEGNTGTRIWWSCGATSAGGSCTNKDGGKSVNASTANVLWADPYIGQIPYALCPPGYRNMATVVPVSFQMGQAGEVVRASDYISEGSNNRWFVNPAARQAIVLQAAGDTKGVIYPGYNTVSSLVYNGGIYTGDDAHESFELNTSSRVEGWYLGLKAEYADTSDTLANKMVPAEDSNNAWLYQDNGSSSYAVAEPLYFQQNTWLKTSLAPGDKGWSSYMGFLYDATVYKDLGGVNAPIRSNNNPKGYNDSDGGTIGFNNGDYRWNVFPVPTNTLEGHATVYCFFDRTQFNSANWSSLVDQVDQLGDDYRSPGDKSGSSHTGYVDRLDDPTLKYDDPW